MDELTQARQALGKRMYKMFTKYPNVDYASLEFDERYTFTFGNKDHLEPCCMWRNKPGLYGIMAVQKAKSGPKDAISAMTRLVDLQKVTRLMPVVEAYLELENARHVE